MDGVRILSPKSVELMTVNHIGEFEIFWPKGNKFGLGFWVTTDLGQVGELASVGTYGWGGVFNTRFWVDPQEDLIGIFMSQVYPSSFNHTQFQVLVYQALVDSKRSAGAAVQH